MQSFESGAAILRYHAMGPAEAPLTFLWAHGWGQSHAAFRPLAQSFATRWRHILVDLPGFGESPLPPADWGTADYAAFLAAFLETIPGRKLWVGHSFGCRVGLQLAARHPAAVAGLFLIAAAGLKRKLPLKTNLYRTLRTRAFKTLKAGIPLGVKAEWLYRTFGSADYRNAGPLRPVFVRTVNEDLSAIAQRIVTPTHFVYGAKDAETPPEFGARFRSLVPGSVLSILPELDHYTVLNEGRHRVAALLADFAQTVEKP